MSTESGGGEHQRWFPLESNPALMNDYVDTLGFDVHGSGHEFVDVFSTEDWALDMIPQPVAAVLVLYPLTDRQLAHRDGDREIQADKVPEVWFMKQRIGTLDFLRQAEGERLTRIDTAPKTGAYHMTCPVLSTTALSHPSKNLRNKWHAPTFHRLRS
jgi:Ubiquitin carboxyl-terminal hydrolase, family 1